LLHGTLSLRRTVRRASRRGAPQVEQLPDLEPECAIKLQKILATFKDIYDPVKMTSAQMEEEMRKYFVPADSSPSSGEVNQADVVRLLVQAGIGARHTFVDVGSGVGKLVLAAVASTKVGHAWGVELSPFRTMVAKQAADQLRDLGVLSGHEHSRTHFIQGSCGEELPHDLLNATHFMLTIRPVSGRSMAMEGPINQFLKSLSRGHLASGQPRILWSVNKELPKLQGMKLTRVIELQGGLNKPPGVWTPPANKKKAARGVQKHAAMGEFGISRSARVYEYVLQLLT